MKIYDFSFQTQTLFHNKQNKQTMAYIFFKIIHNFFEVIRNFSMILDIKYPK